MNKEKLEIILKEMEKQVGGEKEELKWWILRILEAILEETQPKI
ncbi:MAG: hypothetical protein AABY22_21850 [Nanoarchaeota archaeon]